MNSDQFVANYLYRNDYEDALATYKKFSIYIDQLLFWKKKGHGPRDSLKQITVDYVSNAYKDAFYEIEREISFLMTTMQPEKKGTWAFATEKATRSMIRSIAWGKYWMKKLEGEKS